MSNSSPPDTHSKEKKRKKHGKFTVAKMKHRTGTIYWRVTGTTNGKLYRKNFQEKDEATQEMQRLDLQQKVEQNYERVGVTSLPREQCEEAKIAFKRPEGRTSINELSKTAK